MGLQEHLDELNAAQEELNNLLVEKSELIDRNMPKWYREFIRDVNLEYADRIVALRDRVKQAERLVSVATPKQSRVTKAVLDKIYG